MVYTATGEAQGLQAAGIMTVLIVHGKICLHHMHIGHICSTWKTRDARKCVKNFGVLGVSGLNK